MAASPRRVVIAANSAWNVVNFRAGLIDAIRRDGFEPVVVAPHDPSAEDRMAALDVERVVVAMERSGLNPIADLRLFFAYRALLRRLRPVAFLGFTIKPNVYGSLAARTLGIPAMPNISGLGTAFMKPGILQTVVSALYRFALSHAAVVFFQNSDDRALFVERRLVRAKQARLLPGSGVDLDRFAVTPTPEGAPVLLFIGRLLGDKGVRELVEATRLVRTRHRDVRVQLLGPIDDGNRTAVSRAELDRWIGDGLVEYCGATDDVRPFIAAASAAVLPSYREGLPRSLLEAGAMGRPLIATDVPGCRDVVEDGVNGFLCEVRNPTALADAMKRFLDLPAAERSAMGAASRQKIAATFSEDVVIDAYREMLGKIGEAQS